MEGMDVYKMVQESLRGWGAEEGGGVGGRGGGVRRGCTVARGAGP